MTKKTLAIGICLVTSLAPALGLRPPSRQRHSPAKVHSSSGSVEINVPAADIRSAPRADSGALGIADYASRARVLDVTSKWAKLRFVTGMTGWVARNQLAPVRREETVATRVLAREMDPAAEKAAASTNSRSRVLSRAATFKGVRYVYGASSRSATDCSGFTTQVYRSIGVKLPRISWAQARVGKAVPKNALAPGDLVFFRTRGGSRVSHVGIYVGSGRFIHASSSSGRVTYNGLGESYYAKRYAGARRVLAIGTTAKATTIVKEAKKHENQMWINPMGEMDGGSGEIEP